MKEKKNPEERKCDTCGEFTGSFPQQQVALVVRQNCYNNVCGLETHYVINNELFFLNRRNTEETTKITAYLLFTSKMNPG